MDTLCIPPEDEHRDLRARAICNMVEIYALARAVLVLDRSLLRLPCSTSLRSLEAYVASCAWMRRSWTLQEGRVAREVMIQLRDGRLVREAESERWNIEGRSSSPENSVMPSVSSLDQSPEAAQPGAIPRATQETPFLAYGDEDDVRKQISRLIYDQLMPERGRRRFHDFEAVLEKPPKAAEFALVWNALAGRTTTKQSDLYLILANLLDLHTEDLASQASTAESFQRLVLSCETLPLPMLFLTPQRSGPMDERWLPIQFSPEILDHKSSMRISRKRGLLELQDIQRTCDLYCTTCLPDSQRFRMVATRSGQSLHSFERLGSGPWKDDSSDDKHFILVERWHGLPRKFGRGACFALLSEEHRADSATVLKLQYRCALRVQRVTDDVGCLEDDLPTFRARKYRCLPQIFVKCGECMTLISRARVLIQIDRRCMQDAPISTAWFHLANPLGAVSDLPFSVAIRLGYRELL